MKKSNNIFFILLLLIAIIFIILYFNNKDKEKYEENFGGSRRGVDKATQLIFREIGNAIHNAFTKGYHNQKYR